MSKKLPVNINEERKLHRRKKHWYKKIINEEIISNDRSN